MGNTDSTQRLGEKVRSAKEKLSTDLAMQSAKYEYLSANSPETLEVMMKSVADSFQNCSPFLEPTLLIAWKYSPKTCEKIVLQTCEKVLKEPIVASEYAWFKDSLFPSSVWMFKTTECKDRFMYEELLEIGKNMSHGIIESMDSIYSHLETHSKWTQMMNISNTSPISRQDNASVGLLKEVGLKNIFEYESKNEDEKMEEMEEMKTFIDSNVSINILTSTATKINGEFQNHMKTVMSKYGSFKAGPIKKVERCVSKLENDYANEQYPKAAKLLDLVRCSVTFNTVDQLIVGYKGLIQHISKNKSMIELARVKNGFLDAQNGGYRDLKVNVVYKPQINPGMNMVCEVQLMLINYLEEKKRIHKLYSILREELYFAMVVQKDDHDSTDKRSIDDLKFIPELSVTKEIKNSKAPVNIFKSSVDTDTGLLAMEGDHSYFGIVDVKQKKVIHEMKRNEKQWMGTHAIGVQTHKWVTINKQKYVSVQMSNNEIKMFTIENNNELREDENFRITLPKNEKINYCDFDRNFESILLIINDSILQKRSLKNVNDITVSIKLEQNIKQTTIPAFSLSNDGNFCGLAGGDHKTYFYIIDIVAQKQYKLQSKTLKNGSYAPCFINGENEYIAVGDQQGQMEIWDISSKKAIKTISIGWGIFITASASTNNILAIGTYDKKLRLYNVTNWECFYIHELGDMHPFSLHLTHDLQYLTVGGSRGDKCMVLSIQ